MPAQPHRVPLTGRAPHPICRYLLGWGRAAPSAVAPLSERKRKQARPVTPLRPVPSPPDHTRAATIPAAPSRRFQFNGVHDGVQRAAVGSWLGAHGDAVDPREVLVEEDVAVGEEQDRKRHEREGAVRRRDDLPVAARARRRSDRCHVALEQDVQGELVCDGKHAPGPHARRVSLVWVNEQRVPIAQDRKRRRPAARGTGSAAGAMTTPCRGAGLVRPGCAGCC